MSNTLPTAFAAWNIPLGTTLLLLVSGWIYTRGWRAIRETRPDQFATWRLFCFWGGLGAVWLALASPIDALDSLLLTAHMVEHLLLMSVAPPLFALAAPVVPMLRGLPRMWVREGLGPYFRLRPVRAVERLLGSRAAAWLAMNTVFLGWHVPAAYDFALAHPFVHEVEHLMFLLTSVWFWWPIVAPWPARFRGSRWLLLPYLMGADLVNTALSASLCFGGKVLYRTYAQAPRVFGISALDDQMAAGALMWVVGSMFFLGPIMLITVRLLGRKRRVVSATLAAPAAAVARRVPVSPTGARARVSSFDLLRVRFVGKFLKSRWGRQSLQGVLLLLAAAIVFDGLFGHPMGSMNLAGVLPWTYARALFVLALLVLGNLFCMSCPFTLPRELGKRAGAWLGLGRLAWPRALRNKWLAATLLVLFFWAYERWSLWNVPVRTAFLLLAYFAGSFAVDTVFRGAPFCKYVCPVGQFNFLASLLSPLGLAARSTAVCDTCSTHDCIAGNARTGQRGCELDLFVPRKSGSLDCTLCMDCVKACPHDNIGLFLAAPAAELVHITVRDPQRSSVGRLARRPDLAAVALVLVAGAFGSAAAMTAPVADLLAAAAAHLPGPGAEAAGVLLAFACVGVVAAAVAVGAALVREPAGAVPAGFAARLCRWSLALLPLGLGMWAAHLSFHLLTGWNSLAPVTHMAWNELMRALGSHRAVSAPNWAVEASLLSPDSLLAVQMGWLDAGLLASLYLGWRMVRSEGVGATLRAMSPWGLVAVLLYAAGAELLLLPMPMRGMVGM